MSDPLYDLLAPRIPKIPPENSNVQTNITTDLQNQTKYLSRLLSLRLSDLSTTEPQSLVQAHHSNNVSLQALSSRSHKSTITSASHLSTLRSSLPALTSSVSQVRESIPSLDESAVSFASNYSRSVTSTRDRSDVTSSATSTAPVLDNPTLISRKESMLLSNQSDKLTDILELPTLLSTAIASAAAASTTSSGSANYTQALDLHAHIKRLSIIYPDSALVKSVQIEAETAMKSMTTNLLLNLRSSNIRLAAAIRTVGWLRRVVPELSGHNLPSPTTSADKTTRIGGPTTLLSTTSPLHQNTPSPSTQPQSEGSLGALFLVSRLHTFLSTTEALAPLRDLADQETEKRLAQESSKPTTTTQTQNQTTTKPPPSRRPSSSHQTNQSMPGTHSERYLKRYIEIFREQSFNTISMYRNIFPPTPAPLLSSTSTSSDSNTDTTILHLPSALQQFPLHLVEIFMEVLRQYLPNVTDGAARESLLMQVLYAANSLGRLGADFSMMISLLDEETRVVDDSVQEESTQMEQTDEQRPLDEQAQPEPEWARVIKKHRVQAARLDALAAGQNQSFRRGSDLTVR